jgi:translin
VSTRDEHRRGLVDQVAAATEQLAAAHRGRESALPACRKVIQLSGSSIKAAHRRDRPESRRLADEAESVLRGAQAALVDQPAIAHAGFLADCEKEYVEARCVMAMIDGDALPGPGELQVGVSAWLRGVAEAASELRRHLLDRLRDGEPAIAQELFGRLEDCYDVLMTVDFPDAVTGGLRRTLDSLRGVLERSRADLTTTVLQIRLQQSLDARFDSLGSPIDG